MFNENFMSDDIIETIEHELSEIIVNYSKKLEILAENGHCREIYCQNSYSEPFYLDECIKSKEYEQIESELESAEKLFKILT